MRMSCSSCSVQVRKSKVWVTQLETSTLGGSWSTTTCMGFGVGWVREWGGGVRGSGRRGTGVVQRERLHGRPPCTQSPHLAKVAGGGGGVEAGEVDAVKVSGLEESSLCGHLAQRGGSRGG